MPSYNPKTFTKPESLRAMDPGVLRKLLQRFPDFLQDHVPDLADDHGALSDAELPYPQIAKGFASPEAADPKLAEALYIIDEISQERWFDELLDLTPPDALEALEEPPTAADLAILVWLDNPDTLQRLHATSYLDRQRRFTYYVEKIESLVPGWATWQRLSRNGFGVPSVAEPVGSSTSSGYPSTGS